MLTIKFSPRIKCNIQQNFLKLNPCRKWFTIPLAENETCGFDVTLRARPRYSINRPTSVPRSAVRGAFLKRKCTFRKFLGVKTAAITRYVRLLVSINGGGESWNVCRRYSSSGPCASKKWFVCSFASLILPAFHGADIAGVFVEKSRVGRTTICARSRRFVILLYFARQFVIVTMRVCTCARVCVCVQPRGRR